MENITFYEYRLKGKHLKCEKPIYQEGYKFYIENWPLQCKCNILCFGGFEHLHDHNNIGCDRCIELWQNDERKKIEENDLIMKEKSMNKDELLEKLKNLREENKNLKKKNEKLNKNNESISKENQDLGEEIKILRNLNKELSFYNDKFKNSLNSIQKKLNTDVDFFLKEQEKYYKEMNKIIKENLNESTKLKNKYKIEKVQVLPKTYDFYEDLYSGPENIKIEDFKCAICLKIAQQPVNCEKCENIFCKSCVNTHLQINNFCATCKTKPVKFIKISRKLKQYLDEAEFLCPLGCHEKFKYKDLEDHKIFCKNITQKLKCTLCENFVDSDLFNLHEITESHIVICDKMMHECDFCNKKINKMDLEIHFNECNKCLIFSYCSDEINAIKKKVSNIRETFNREVDKLDLR